jgi:hypothetical protein
MSGTILNPLPKSLKDVLYTRVEVARMAKVCTHTVARDVRASRLQEIRFNRRRVRYSRESVEAYLRPTAQSFVNVQSLLYGLNAIISPKQPASCSTIFLICRPVGLGVQNREITRIARESPVVVCA